MDEVLDEVTLEELSFELVLSCLLLEGAFSEEVTSVSDDVVVECSDELSRVSTVLESDDGAFSSSRLL